jgi:apolipoprotein N-acyltransferase
LKALWRFLGWIGPDLRDWKGDWRLFAMALASALLVRLAFPRWDFFFVAGFGLVPLLWAVPRARSGKQAFYLGWVYGAVFYYLLVFALTYLVEYRRAIPPAILIPVAIPGAAIYLGLFKGLFAWLFWRASCRPGVVQAGNLSRPAGDEIAAQAAGRPGRNRLPTCTTFGPANQPPAPQLHCAPQRPRFVFLFAALAWVGTDYLQSLGDLGFPWGYLGHALYLHPPLIQLAAWTGVYGLTLVLFWINHLLADILGRLKFVVPASAGGRGPASLPAGRATASNRKPPLCSSPTGREGAWGSPSVWNLLLRTAVLALFAAIVVFTALDAEWRVAAPGFYSTPPLTIGIVQPNIPQDTKFESYEETEQAAKLHAQILGKTVRLTDRLTSAAGAARCDLIIWPETAVTDDRFALDPRYASYFKDLVTNRFKTALFFGAANLIRLRHGKPLKPDEFRFEDYEADPSAFAIEAYVSGWLAEPGTGVVPKPYNKMQLVPFAEATPFLPFGSSFKRGNEHTVFAVHEPDGHGVLFRFGPMICFESVYPRLARGMVGNGAEVLVVITNDAWYKETDIPRQHQLESVFRAVENRRWLARSANHGISCFISPLGEIVAETPLSRDAAIRHEVRGTKELTIYTRVGDLFAIFALMAAAIWAIAAGRIRSSAKGS